MKVVFFIPDMRGGGAEKVALLLIRQVVSLGYSTDLLLLRKEGELLGAIPKSVNVVTLGDGRIRNSLFPLCRYLKRENPDHLIVSMWPLTTVSVVASLLSGYQGRLLLSEHSALSESPQARGLSGILLRLSMRFVNSRADYVVGVSSGVVDDLHSLGLPSSFGIVVNNPVQISSLSFPGDGWLEHPWYQLEKRKRLLAVGSLKPAKDYPVMLNAMKSLRKDNSGAQLLIMGGGPLEADLMALRKELGLEDSVHFGGWVLDPSPFYHSAGCLVLSSRWEGFGNVIVEALAAGVPVVSTDCKSGPAEILENGKYGKLVPVGDPSALAIAIEESLSEPFDPEALKARAKDFSPEIIAKRYLELAQ
ncbi:glycosyltransferase [Alcanivorax jadensis]|uniref:glycosyltransferase n=1 Tax=Alcanivorax jadensis TaxID=64988 RepID=UPI00240A1DEA|nr:glycosyltransferase [Alcanivorax jadensis]MDF1637581.1 glycosyltransferase [Alcanivorax jadensis]